MKWIIEKTGFIAPVVSINISVHLLQKLPFAQKKFRPSGVLKHGKLNFLRMVHYYHFCSYGKASKNNSKSSTLSSFLGYSHHHE
jgi:hypothetical protein